LTTAQHLPRQRIGKRALVDDHDAIDQHVGHTFRELIGLCVGRDIANPGRIENRDVRGRTLADDAPISHAEYRRRQARHRSNRKLEADDVPLAHVDAQPSRKRAVVARVRLAGARKCQAAITRRHRVGLRHDLADVVLGHVERHDRRVAAGDHLERSAFRRQLAAGRDLLECFAL
jgi:hypothetical protein